MTISGRSLRGEQNFKAVPACRTIFYPVNTSRPRFDNALVRKPLVGRLNAAKMDSVRFKYAWIETQWRDA